MFLLPVERQRMGACFRRHHLQTPHAIYIDDVYDPRLPDGHVKSPGLRMQEDYIWNPAERNVTENAA